jgi:hypothetical protein
MSTITTKDGAEFCDEDFGEDHRTGEAFQLNVHENDNALDMFDHPYAYAAHRRIDYGWPAHGQDFRIAA